MTENLPARTTSSPAISLSLSRWLGTGESVEDAARAIIAAEAVEELRTSLPAIAEQAKRPAGVIGVREAIFPWFATYPQPARSDAEKAAFWSAYVEVCGDQPADALIAGMKAWAARPDSEFLPKPGQLRELAQQQTTPGFRLYNRAHKVLVEVERITGEQHVAARMEADQVKPEGQAEAVRGMLADFRAQQHRDRTSGRMLKPDREGPLDTRLAGKPAPGGHLTPQMYAAMGWAPPTPPAATPQAREAHAEDPDRDFV